MKKFILLLNFIFIYSFSLLAQAGAFSINALETPYTQNFNTLTSASNWTDGNTLTGWYAKGASIPINYGVNNGSETSTSPSFLYSFGTTSSSNRSLGFVPTGSNGVLSYLGWRFKNNTGVLITSITISWDGEQWRNGSTLSQSIDLKYKVSSSAIISIPSSGLSATVNSFVSPQVLSSGESAVVLNGKIAENRQTMLATIPVSIPAGHEIMFCWIDKRDQFYYDHLFSIDNVSVTASTLSPQTISFPAVGNKVYGDAAFSLEAEASSGLAVSYASSNHNIATVLGDVLTIKGVGTVTITANQSGDASYTAASPVQATLNVYPQKPVLNLPTDITSSSFRVSWTAENGLTDASVDYLLYVDDNKSFSSPAFYSSSDKLELVAGLSSNKIYYVKVISDYNGSLYSDESDTGAVGLGSVVLNSSGNLSSVVGSSIVATSLTLNSDLVLDNGLDLVADDLTVNSPSSVTVGVGSQLKINNRLTLISNLNNETGKVWNNGTVDISNAAEIVVRKSFNTGKWYFTGFPYTVSTIYHQGTTDPVSWGNGSTPGDIYVKRYNGNVRAATGINPGLGVWDYFTPLSFTGNRGYILWSHNNSTYDFVVSAANKGQIFNTAASYSVGQYASAEITDVSWNLVINPFITTFNLSKSSQGPYYIYNSLADNYQVYMPGATYNLTPNTAFFLQAQSSSLNFSSDGRKLMPTAVSNEYAGYEELNLNLSNGDYSDLTRVRLQKNATNEYEIGQDAIKMYSLNNLVPQLFTKLNRIEYAVNAMPYETKSFDLFVKAGTIGDYSISLSDFNLLPNCTKVSLFDKDKSIETDLLTNDHYMFHISKVGTFNRFKVIVETEQNNIVTQLNGFESSVKMLTENNAVAFEGLDSPATIKVFDISAKLLLEYHNINNGEFIHIPNNGMNILEVRTSNNTYKFKSIIK